MKRILSIIILLTVTITSFSQESILNHKIVLNESNELIQWNSYHNVITSSINFLKNCPTIKTNRGNAPYYLITSKFNEDGSFIKKQNNQGSNVYWAVETHKKYYAYSGDKESLIPVGILIDRVMEYLTPKDWAWPNVPRTQDDNSDGEYTDEWSGVDKICMAAIGFINYYKLTNNSKYLRSAIEIAKSVLPFIKNGDENNSPLPFRVNLRTGEILDPYSSDMIFVVKFLDELIKIDDCSFKLGQLKKYKSIVTNWIYKYPMKNNIWSGYFEDMKPDINNCNQVNPLETARYILRNSNIDPNYKSTVTEIIKWVKQRYTKKKYYGASSIAEQDSFFLEMSSHTARYGSILAMMYGVSLNKEVKKEASATLALSTYSAFNKYSKSSFSLNATGIEYPNIWFSDSYWDYVSHYFDAIAELPEMLEKNQNHIFYSSSVINYISYSENEIAYNAYDDYGEERIKLTYEPVVYSNNEVLEKSMWSFGLYHDVSNILIIKRKNAQQIVIKKK